MKYESATNRCGECGAMFKTLADEAGTHECPRCGKGPKSSEEDEMYDNALAGIRNALIGRTIMDADCELKEGRDLLERVELTFDDGSTALFEAVGRQAFLYMEP